MKKRLFIDTGHSLRYPGAHGVKAEVDWNRAIFRELTKFSCLSQDLWEYILVPDSFLTDWSGNRNLQNRINWINARSTVSDHLLSIHGNYASNPSVRGVTTCYMGGSDAARGEAVQLSLMFQKETKMPLWAGGAFDDRNSRFGRLGMVRDTKPFALLIEAGFVSNAADMDVSPSVAARGIAAYYNNLK